MPTYNKLLDSLNMDVMGFLNEAQLNFPEAISLASGRPDQDFFDLEYINDYFDTYVSYVSENENKSKKDVLNHLGQYNRSKGFINDLVVKYLNHDCNIKVTADDIMITVGSQEGMMLSILSLCDKNDAIIIEDPTYVGVSHFLSISGYKTIPNPISPDGICLQSLERNLKYSKEKNEKVKLVYVTPDFQNPTGTRMPIENRIRLLELAEIHDFFILEDNAYGSFVFGGEQIPSLKSLDLNNNVIHLHSFSKLLHPSLRVSVLIADKVLNNKIKVSNLLAKMKGYTTVNTPAIPQAVLAGIMIKHDFTLKKYLSRKIQTLKEKRDKVIEALTLNFGNDSRVTWNIPDGGYFLTLTLPFQIDKTDVLKCAEEYNVIFTPMSFFYLNRGGENQIRISYSYASIDEIDKAIRSLFHFIDQKQIKHQLL